MNYSVQIYTDDDSFSASVTIDRVDGTDNYEFATVGGGYADSVGGIIFNHDGTPLELVAKVLTLVSEH